MFEIQWDFWSNEFIVFIICGQYSAIFSSKSISFCSLIFVFSSIISNNTHQITWICLIAQLWLCCLLLSLDSSFFVFNFWQFLTLSLWVNYAFLLQSPFCHICYYVHHEQLSLKKKKIKISIIEVFTGCKGLTKNSVSLIVIWIYAETS